MKTIEEFSKEVLSNNELRKEVLSLKPENVETFLKNHDCCATLDEVKSFFIKQKSSSQLSEEELNQVVGGSYKEGKGTIFICTNPNCSKSVYNDEAVFLEGDHRGEKIPCPGCGQILEEY